MTWKHYWTVDDDDGEFDFHMRSECINDPRYARGVAVHLGDSDPQWAKRLRWEPGFPEPFGQPTLPLQGIQKPRNRSEWYSDRVTASRA